MTEQPVWFPTGQQMQEAISDVISGVSLRRQFGTGLDSITFTGEPEGGVCVVRICGRICMRFVWNEGKLLLNDLPLQEAFADPDRRLMWEPGTPWAKNT